MDQFGLMSNSCVQLSPLFTLNKSHRLRSRILVRSIGGDNSIIVSRDFLKINGASCIEWKNCGVASYECEGKKSTENVPQNLEHLWDDGYGTQTVKDYVEISMDLIKSDGGRPRWFCPVACGIPLKDSPLLFYLPGIDGTGAGLVVHEKALGKVFHVQCLHIPVCDRTPLEGLIQIVEEIVINEHTLSPNNPIYLLGDSFGGSLALAVAARNPTIDLILILANPATCYRRSPAHPLISPEGYYEIFPNAISPILGNFVKMTMIWQLFGNLAEDLPLLSMLARILPKETLNWRLKLVESAAAYVNSRLQTITSQVLVLASGRDNLMNSKYEARRLSKVIKNCIVRVFEESGHTILLESGINLLSTIKTTHTYRRSSKFDIFKDFLSLSMTEFKNMPMENWWYRLFTGTAIFSTMEDGKIVRGLAGIPDEGPVLAVGNHTFWGYDVFSLVPEFMREKKIVLHGLAHPEVYQYRVEDEHIMIPFTNVLKSYGTVPVSARNLYKLLSTKSYALLYPGGARESLHRKGESCKLFWPEKQEFVRMAMKLGATIIPFGAVGEDDLSEQLIDYNDMKNIPFLNDMVNDYNRGRTNVRAEMGGEIAKQPLHVPIFLPKLPGRLYFKFGKPIRTKGKENMLNDKDYMRDLYLQIRRDVEKNIAYLLNKRNEDPYRGIVERFVWQTNYGSLDQVPSFDP